jgi:hypothetical protein
VLSAILLVALAGSAEGAPRTFSVVAGSGQTGGGAFTAAPEGAIIQGPAGARLELAPGTEVRMFSVPQDLQLAPGSRTRTYTVLVRTGRVSVELPEQGASKTAILVGLPRKLMAISTGGRLVAVASPKMSGIVNIHGDVVVSNGRAFRPLAAGRVRRATAGGQSEVDVPAAPSWAPGPRVWVAVQGRQAVDGLAWSPVADAARYEVSLQRAGDALPQSVQVTSSPKLEAAFGPVAPGVYQATVRAIDENDIGGRVSEPVRLHVLGVALPGGAFAADDGTLFLAPGQKAEFSHGDGLLMSFLGATRYYPASGTVGLYRNEKTIVHFRAEGSNDLVSVRLQPREIRADVFVGPKTAIWPRDEVKIRVQLRSSNGTPLPSSVEVVPKVSLGIDPLDVPWKRENDLLTAVVPQPRTPGPWVVRVEVNDQFGIPLGRDFLEIVAEKPKPRDPNQQQAARPAKRPRS